MFAKIFESIYDGTLAENWQGLVTFQQLLILKNSDGVVDMTPGAIARKTGIPREIIDAGLAFLERPDPQSRTKAMEGRRIARLSDDREWGWFIVNHAEYRARVSREEKREADRLRIAAKRATECDEPRQDATSSAASQNVADVAHSRLQSTEKEKAKTRAVGEAEPTGEGAPVGPTDAARACQQMIAAGIPPHRCNPSNAKLLDALAEGVPVEAFAAAVPGALAAKATNPFVWAIQVARSEHAARGSPTPEARAGPGESRTMAAMRALDDVTVDANGKPTLRRRPDGRDQGRLAPPSLPRP